MKRLLLLACLLPDPAWACSCIESTLERHVVPADGSVDFPLDGQLRIFLTGGYPAPLRARLGEEYRLVGPTGPVPFTASVERTRLDLKPVAPLAAKTRYVLEAVFAYDATGRRLDDEERLGREVKTEKRYWFPVVAFTTGDQTSAPPTRIPDLASVQIDRRMGGGDCGPGASLQALWRPVPLARFEVLALEVEGQGVIETAPQARPLSDGQVGLSAGDLLCDPDPVAIEPRTQRVRLVVLSPSGTRSETLWTKSGAERGLFGHFAKPAGERLRSRASRPAEKPLPDPWDPWFEGTPTDPPPQAPAGPPACPHGLEGTLAWEVDPRWTPQTYEDVPAVGPAAGGAAALVEGEASARWVRVGELPAEGPLLPGSLAAGVLSSGSGAALLATYAGEDTALALTALAADGTPRWTRPLAQHGRNWRPRVAECAGRFAVAWQLVEGGLFSEATLQWAVFDAKGQPVARGPGERIGMIDGMGLGCHGDGFALLTPTVPGHTTPVLRLIDPQGGLKVVPASALVGETWSITRWRVGSAIAATKRPGGIQVTLLDAAGAPLQSVEVARGRHDRKPAITAYGDLLAVAWETWPGQKAWATVLDAEGRVASPVALGHGLARMTTAITATEDGLLAVGSARPPSLSALAPPTAGSLVESGFEIELLRCRSTPAPGAPPRLTMH